MDKPTKPTDLIPRSFGGVKNNFSPSLQSSGYEDGVPAIYGGDNLNYQLDATGKELDYCETICDFINALPIGKSITTDANNKLIYTDKANISLDNLNANGKARIAVKEYLVTETYIQGDVVLAIIDNEVKLFKSLVNNNTGNALSDDTKWEEVKLGGGASRNIGEIVISTISLTDAGLHLLDGSLIQGSGIYSDFVDYIASIYDAAANYFCTEAEWQTAVTTYGVCGKFVYDSVNNTVRLPKVTGIIEGTVDVSALGDLVEAGLPNITGHFRATGSSTQDFSGAFSAYSEASTAVTSSYGTYDGVKFDASESNSIYGNSSTVQPQAIKYYYYIVIATSTKTDIQVDIDEIATDLNGKVNISDLSEVQCVVETYQNGTSWYRVYSDGWCEQGGYIDNSSGGKDVTFLKVFANTNYTITQSVLSDVRHFGNNCYSGLIYKTTTGFTIGIMGQATDPYGTSWRACGYIEV